MYLTPWAAVALFLLAAVGSLSILASVGVWIFTARLPEANLPADEVVAAHTGNVRVITSGVTAREMAAQLDATAARLRRNGDAS